MKLAVAALILSLTASPLLAQDAPSKSAAPALMKRGLYKDASKALHREIKSLSEAQAGSKYLMLAECYYLQREFEKARPYYVKAKQNIAGGKNRKITEYRLACVAFRLGDNDGAMRLIDIYEKTYPNERRTGILLLFKLKLLAKEGKPAQARLETLNAQIQKRIRQYGHGIGVAADNVLTDFFQETGQKEKARKRYMRIVHGFRNVISQYAAARRPVPAGLEQSHDNAAMQLGMMGLKAKNYNDAVRWLENVRYNAAFKAQAKLLLAQVAYQKRDFNRAASYITSQGFIDTVPAGPLKSDMYLLLGMCEKAKTKPNLSKVIEYLEKVKPNLKGFFQAQFILGDIYRERGYTDWALKTYSKAAKIPKYEAQALYHLGQLYMGKAKQEKTKTQIKALHKKAAEHFSRLSTKYPSSELVKRASESIDVLLAKGLEVNIATSDQEMARRWEVTVKKNPGTMEAARALSSIARLHYKSVMDEKRQRYIKAPNYGACAAACIRLLDSKQYDGKGFVESQWRDVQVEAHYYRGLSHLASIGAQQRPKAGVAPNYVAHPSNDKAIEDFTKAKELVDQKRLDLVKSIEISLLEALFKSDNEEHLKKAESRFAELANDYGSDVRFQKLAMDLAEWYRRQGRYREAAREYRGIADRGTNLTQVDRMKALFMAGKLHSKAAVESHKEKGETRFGIYIYPKEVFKPKDIMKAYSPFRKKIRIKWPKDKKDLTGLEAIQLVSKHSEIPFVWSPDKGKNTIADYLANKRVKFKSLKGTVENFVKQILDPNFHEVSFDIGITGGKPTLEPQEVDLDEPDLAKPIRVIEIQDTRRWVYRYKPLARDYGIWRNTHKSNAMMYHVVERIENISKTKVLWAEGVEKGDVLAVEYSAVPGLNSGHGAPIADVITRLLNPLDLRYRIIERNRAAEIYEEAKDCFNEIRKIDPKSKYGERSLFLLAMNFYKQKDFERMKIVLREYLKVFDSPNNEHYHEACFWVGWAFENERNYRDACRNYNRAAEERLVIYKPGPSDPSLTREQLKTRLSYDTQFALEEVVSGSFKDYELDGEFLDFIRLNSNVEARVEEGASVEATLKKDTFTNVAVFKLLCDTLEPLGLSFHPENMDEETAQRAYYRLASTYKKDGMMDQALASINALFTRFPMTSRKRDAYKLKIEIYKGLKDYRNVLDTLELMKADHGVQIEAYKIDYEMGMIYFDLCRYQKATGHFKKSLAATKDNRERHSIRESYAKSLFRAGDNENAYHQYQTLVKDEPNPLRKYVDRLMLWYLELATDRSAVPEFPEDISKLIRWYENLNETQISQVSQNTIAKVTWIYYVAGLADLEFKDSLNALKKFEAAASSPDDWLAADALYRAGIIHMKAKRFKKAKESFEYLLFSTRSAEAEVKATYALGLLFKNMGNTKRVDARFDQVLRRFPDSAQADWIRKKRTEGEKKEGEKKREKEK